jgi:hypothetical protein
MKRVDQRNKSGEDYVKKHAWEVARMGGTEVLGL